MAFERKEEAFAQAELLYKLGLLHGHREIHRFVRSYIHSHRTVEGALSYEEAVAFHGGTDPWLALGYRMGRFVAERLGDWGGLVVEVQLDLNKPYIPLLDGLQCTTGSIPGPGEDPPLWGRGGEGLLHKSGREAWNGARGETGSSRGLRERPGPRGGCLLGAIPRARSPLVGMGRVVQLDDLLGLLRSP